MAVQAHTIIGRVLAPITIDLSAASLSDLYTAYAAYQAANSALVGVYNMPRCRGDVVSWLNNEIERASDMQQAIVEEVRLREPDTREDRELRAEVLVRWAIECGDWAGVIAGSMIDSKH